MNPVLSTTVCACALLFTASCSCSKEAESGASTPESPQPVTEIPAGLLQSQGGPIDPFTGQPLNAKGRITELPTDAFFQDHNYPGSKVLDVGMLFMAPTVWLHTQDSYDEVDAHYRVLFTKPDGEVSGRKGRYYNEMEDGTVQKVSFSRAEGGGILIVLSM